MQPTTPEAWKPIPGYEGRYEASSHGRIRALLPRGTAKHGPHVLPLTPRSKTSPYFAVNLRDGDHRNVTIPVHVAVIAAFRGTRPLGLVTRHLDGDSHNNTIENLAYGTYAENSADAIRHGTNYALSRTRCPKGHPYDESNTLVGTQHNGGPHRGCKTCQEDWRIDDCEAKKVRNRERYLRLKALRAEAA